MKEFYIDCTKLGAPDKYERTKKNNATDEEVYDIIDEFIWYDKGYLVTCKNGTVTNVKNLSSDYLKEHYDGYRVLSFRHSVITADLSSREIRLKFIFVIISFIKFATFIWIFTRRFKPSL